MLSLDTRFYQGKFDHSTFSILLAMVSEIKSPHSIRSSASLFRSCETAHQLIKDGREQEAKELYPMEYYLVKKYLFLNIEEFIARLTQKLEMK